jgi:hypothetical protein
LVGIGMSEKSSSYYFGKRGIDNKEQFLLDGIDSIHECFHLYEGGAVNLCIRDILINFNADGWSTGFHDGQEVKK